MTDWVIPSNRDTFDVDRALLEREEIDWSETPNAHLRVGDRVFLYQTAPVSAITHVCEVVSTGVTSAETIGDREYWGHPEAFAERQDRTWMRLRRVWTFGTLERAALGIEALREAGISQAPQGRRRAQSDVSALVDRIMAMPGEHAQDLIAEERNLLHSLGHPHGPWRSRRGGRGGATTFASFDAALETPGAATALALLRVFVQSAGLQPDGQWSVSALPAWSGPRGEHRFATINGNQIELFYVWMDSSSGAVTRWGVRLSSRHADALSSSSGFSPATSKGDDVFVEGETVDQLLRVLDDHDVRAAVRENAAERATRRRTAWHNPYLSALLLPPPADVADESGAEEPDDVEDTEFERRYIERVTRSRQHQAPLRRAALSRYSPPACHYCRLDVVEVLDAAHIVPDSEGGAASIENIRLLCANHHRAYDRGLLVWDMGSQSFMTAPGSPEVLPSPPDDLG